MKRIKVKAYQSEIRAEEIGFTNFERLEERELFDIIMQKLKKCNNIELGKKQIGPSEDLYECKIEGHEFTLFYDIDYGTSIYASEPVARKIIIDTFNN